MMPDTGPTPPGTPEVPGQTAAKMAKPPELTATPKKCNACDMMVTLGILTSSCEDIDDPTQRNACKVLLKPLEEGKVTAVDALSNVIIELGEEHLDNVIERFNLLVYEATAKAKENLIAKGVLNKDGTQKV